MNKLTLFCVVTALILFSIHLKANTQVKIDKSNKAFLNSRNDTTKINAFLDLSQSYAVSNLDSAFSNAQRSLDFSKIINSDWGLMKSYIQLGELSLIDEDLRQAETYFLKVYDYANKIEDFEEAVFTLLILGNINFVLGIYPKSLEFWLEGNTLAESKGKYGYIPEFYSNIGNLYYQTAEYKSAFLNFELSHKTAIKYDRHDLYANSLNNMALIEFYNKNYGETINYATQILSLLDSIPGTNNFIPAAYGHLATSYYKLGEYDSSLYHYSNMLGSLTVVDKMYYGPTIIDEIKVNIGLGKCYISLKQFELAKKHLVESHKNAINFDFTEALSEVSELLSIVYEETGDLNQSLRYYKLYKQYSDSLFSDDKIRELTKVQLEFEYSEKKKQEELEQSIVQIDQQRKEFRYIVIISSAALLLIILILLFLLQKNRTKSSELKRVSLKLNLDFKNQELTSNVLYLLRKNELLINISSRLKKIRLSKLNFSKSIIDDLINEIELNSKDMGWEEFELRFKDVHSQFYTELTNRFPNLTSNELRLCAFLRLNMSTKDISAITFQSDHSIVMARSRLKKKLQIEDNVKLASFLIQL